VRDQAGKASAAAFTARATSSARPRGTSAIGRRCAGSSTSSHSPEALSTHLPPINMRSFLSAVSSLRILLIAGIVISIASSVAAVPRTALRR
jgi:hypothetical protein